MNVATIIGNLTRDPERRETTKGVTVAIFTVAVNRRKSQNNPNPGADFIQCKCFGNRAESCLKYLSKGSKVGVVGSINTYSYDGTDGQKKYVTEVLVSEINFLQTYNGKGQQEQENSDFEQESAQSYIYPDDDLPF
jgi:single-strand DNA-binding protein